MSTVLSALIVVEHYGPVHPARLEENLSNFSEHRQNFRKMNRVMEEHAGGHKIPEVDLWYAGFTYVPIEALLHWFENLPWGNYGCAQLIWTDTDQYRGTVNINWED